MFSVKIPKAARDSQCTVTYAKPLVDLATSVHHDTCAAPTARGLPLPYRFSVSLACALLSSPGSVRRTVMTQNVRHVTPQRTMALRVVLVKHLAWSSVPLATVVLPGASLVVSTSLIQTA